MNLKQKWAGGLMILSGVNLILGSTVGFGRVWPLYALGIGLLMLLAPWAEEPAKRNSFRIGGFWLMVGGLAGLLSVLGYHGFYGPLFMIGAGVMGVTGLYQKKEA